MSTMTGFAGHGASSGQGLAGRGLRLVTPSRLNALITVMAQTTTRYCSSVNKVMKSTLLDDQLNV